MDTITFHSFATQSARQRIQILKQKWDTTTCKAPESPEGKGSSFEKMQKLGEEYVLLHGAVSILLANTLQFLEKTEDSFVNTDKKWQMKLEDKGKL